MRRLSSAALVVLFIVAGRASAAAAEYQTVAMEAPHLGGMTHFSVILPTGYNNASRRYPVLYLLHRYMDSYTNWVKLTHLTARTAGT